MCGGGSLGIATGYEETVGEIGTLPYATVNMELQSDYVSGDIQCTPYACIYGIKLRWEF